WLADSRPGISQRASTPGQRSPGRRNRRGGTAACTSTGTRSAISSSVREFPELSRTCSESGDRCRERCIFEDGTGVIFLSAPVVVCADGPTVPGIDVSIYQGTIDWQKVHAAGIEFAFIRVSDGLDTLDSKYDVNWAGARAAGVLRGTYQFFREN